MERIATNIAFRESNAQRLQIRRRAYTITIVSWIVELILMEGVRIASDWDFTAQFWVARILWLVTGVLTGVVLWRIIERFRHIQFWKLAALLVVLTIFLSTLHTISNRSFLFWIMDEWPKPVNLIAQLYGNTRFWMHFHLAWAAVILALIYATKVKREQEGRSKAQALARQAQIQAFRYQIHPHFLFNSFNSIAALILDKRGQQAEKMIRQLSSFLRRGLSNKTTSDVPLEEELAQQREYLELERERFPDRLILEFDVADGLHSALVPGSILQPLVENAVRHGVGGSVDSTTVSIGASENNGRLTLVVRDTGTVPSDSSPRDKESGGLRYVENRLTARYNHDYSFAFGPTDAGGYQAKIEIPLQHAQLIVSDRPPSFAVRGAV